MVSTLSSTVTEQERNPTAHIRGSQHDRQQRDDDGERNVGPVTHQYSKQGKILAATEHISMDTLPSGLVMNRHIQRISFILLRITDIVQRESSHHNQRDQARQEHDDHERIEDAEPMDLRLEKVEFQVAVESVPELHSRRNELD